MATPKISIVTPVYNAERTVARTLDALAGQHADFEHVAYDGGSKDGTCAIVESRLGTYPLRLMRGENLGVYGNVANAHKTTTGDVMGWINGDDFYMPWTLAVVERIFRDHPEVEWLTGIPAWHFEGHHSVVCQGYAPVFLQSAVRRGWHTGAGLGWLQQESMFWRRSLYERAGADGVLRRWKYAADFHLWRAFAKSAQLHTVSTVLAAFSVRQGQFSSVNRDKYDKECGVRGSVPGSGRIGQMVMRVMSQLLSRRVIYRTPFPSFETLPAAESPGAARTDGAAR
jgi:glycosyltransferase involved in cell wall biosynthesis